MARLPVHVDVGVVGNDHWVPPTEAARRGIHLYVGPESRRSRPWKAACLRSIDVDEGDATPVRADLQGRGLPGDDFHETEHLLLGHVLAADGAEEASPSRSEGGPRISQPAAEEGGVPLVPKRRCHVHLLRPGGDLCLMEQDGKAPLLGQHADDEELLISTGRRPRASSECVPEGPIWRDEAVAQVPGEEPEGVACRFLLESAVPRRHRRGVCRVSQVPGVCWGYGLLGASSQGGQSRGDGPLMGCTAGSRGRFGCLPFRNRSHHVAGRPGGGGAGRTGRATGTSVPVPGGCGRPPPCPPPGRQRAPRATPGVAASPRLCGICPYTGGISWVPWPPLLEGAAPTCVWRSPVLARRVGWPAEPCAAPARGLGLTGRGPLSRARAQDPGQCRAARPPVATPASVWRQFGARACLTTAGRGTPGASGIPWSGPQAGAPGRRGAPHPATLPALPPWRCP